MPSKKKTSILIKNTNEYHKQLQTAENEERIRDKSYITKQKDTVKEEKKDLKLQDMILDIQMDIRDYTDHQGLSLFENSNTLESHINMENYVVKLIENQFQNLRY